uniref:Uncharacterized protein n=1 Tax=Zooxanthella nutricula TaxID=1333877 RepID=A0A7S2LZA2_9DINO
MRRPPCRDGDPRSQAHPGHAVARARSVAAVLGHAGDDFERVRAAPRGRRRAGRRVVHPLPLHRRGGCGGLGRPGGLVLLVGRRAPLPGAALGGALPVAARREVERGQRPRTINDGGHARLPRSEGRGARLHLRLPPAARARAGHRGLRAIDPVAAAAARGHPGGRGAPRPKAGQDAVGGEAGEVLHAGVSQAASPRYL